MRLTSILFCVVHHEVVGSLMFLAANFNVTCNLWLSFLQLREGPRCMHLLVFMLHGMHLAFHLLTHVAKMTDSYLLISRMCEERSGIKSLHAINLHAHVHFIMFVWEKRNCCLQLQEPRKITESMVILISSASSVVESDVVIASPTPIMEYIIGFVPPQ